MPDHIYTVYVLRNTHFVSAPNPLKAARKVAGAHYLPKNVPIYVRARGIWKWRLYVVKEAGRSIMRTQGVLEGDPPGWN